MKKKLIAFDLDDTLAVAKSPISDRMGELLVKLLDKYEVCIISGGKFEQFKIQVVDRIDLSPRQAMQFHMMPTCGTQYFRYDSMDDDWKRQYSYFLSDEQKKRTIKALEEGAKELGLWEAKPFGDIIEDRGSQITFSALGQKAPADLKYKWDPDGSKKMKLRDYVAPILSDLEVRTGGTTSVDVTLTGVDKAFGMQKLIEELGISKEDILYIGDKMTEGGNDYPVKAMGIESIAVEKWEDTALVLEGILGVTD